MKYLFLLLTLVSAYTFGQNHSHENPRLCGEHIERAKLINSSEAFRIQDSIDQVEFQAGYEAFLENWSPYDRSAYTIPVVVHVVHTNGIENISNEQIYEAIDRLNDDFNMTNWDLGNTVSAFQGITGNASIEFKLATQDPQGNCHSGITRTLSGTTYDEGMSWGSGGHPIVDAVAAQHGVWPQGRYMSIFVCLDPAGNAGYTYRPSNAFSPNQMYGAIFMRHDYMGSIGTSTGSHRHTLSHEAGHWLNLAHLWGNTNNPGVLNSCNSDDGVSDTPNTIGWTTCNTSGVSCGTLDNVQNIMEYSYCSTMFTHEQAARMQFALQNPMAGRDNLSTDFNLQQAGVYSVNNDICAAEFATDKRVVCAGDTVRFSDASVHNIIGRNWQFAGGNPSVATDSIVEVIYSTPGEYDVTLEVYNTVTNQTTTYNNHITVLDPDGRTIPFVEDFETTTSFPENSGFTIENLYNDYTWQLSNESYGNGSKSLVLKNYYVNVPSSDAFISETIDLSVLDDDEDFILSFKYAYRKKNPTDDEWLKVYASNDCGATWFLRKAIHGNVVGDQTYGGFFSPGTEDWQTITITNIHSGFYVSNFRYKIEFTSDLGNNIYIDNINLSSPVFADVSDVEIEKQISVYPNPVQNTGRLNLIGYANEFVDIQIYNTSGQQVNIVYSGIANSSDQTFDIDLSGLSKGVYFVKVNSEHSNSVVKLIKE